MARAKGPPGPGFLRVEDGYAKQGGGKNGDWEVWRFWKPQTFQFPEGLTPPRQGGTIEGAHPKNMGGGPQRCGVR